MASVKGGIALVHVPNLVSISRELSSKLKDLLGNRSDITIAVGDIHGCDAAAARAVAELEKAKAKNVIFLGDYLDRGPSSVNTVEVLATARKNNPEWKFLLGNHELIFIEEVFGPEPEMVYDFPQAARDQYKDFGKVPYEHREFILSLLPYHESESFIYVHGGIGKDFDRPIGEHSVKELVWVYEISEKWKGKPLVRGHRIVNEPVQNANHICLDTGCWHYGFLTLGILDDKTGQMLGWVQVSSDGEWIREWWKEEQLRRRSNTLNQSSKIRKVQEATVALFKKGA